MRNLNLSHGSFDHVNTFGIELPGFRGPRTSKASLYMGAKHSNDGILWVMQHAAVIADRYSATEIAERERVYREEAPVRNGDVVLVNGKQYIVQVIGDYSNCAYLCPAEDFHGTFRCGKGQRKFTVKGGMVTTRFYTKEKVTMTYAKFIETFHGREAPIFLS